jgi:hypothetical protein
MGPKSQLLVCIYKSEIYVIDNLSLLLLGHKYNAPHKLIISTVRTHYCRPNSTVSHQMTKTATKKDPNKKHTSILSARRVAAASAALVATGAATRQSLISGTAVKGKMRKKLLSRQQANQARHTLDAEFRDLRTRVSFYRICFSPPSPLPSFLPSFVSFRCELASDLKY